ncbi:MAG TPA: glucosamine-6-phosphate deaminase [Candidatus Avipropionibacterium avicola]|uniref:Glucosamine-6-phosphate deaminase n=1 Tax=Candidatus Avipropionibacterium avicola TaxID=2840701 RepID=A0A9D1KNJ7_9ACTN|nr:glucosamine-6-phosphate deaminase [Candidatus Avipropionibacterium avicola]
MTSDTSAAQVDPVRTLTAGDLSVRAHTSAEAMGRDAARQVAEVLRATIAEKGSARAILATGNSQYPLMDALAAHREEYGIDWSKVTAFHMDEYVGIDADHTASFRRWMRERVEQRLGVGVMNYINGDSGDAEAECARYEALLREAPIDLTCMGIGENGHLAFNEPHVAKFDDPRWANVITLDETSRNQQVGEGHFPDFDAVPAEAISLSIPALLSASTVVVCVPEARKADAVHATLNDEISTACPGTILRRAPQATLYLDNESSARI